MPVRRVGSGPRSPVVADSEILDAWLRHGGKLSLDALDTEAVIASSKRLLTEIEVARRNLDKGVRLMRETISTIRQKQARLKDVRGTKR
jgi:hypothetical protein